MRNRYMFAAILTAICCIAAIVYACIYGKTRNHNRNRTWCAVS